MSAFPRLLFAPVLAVAVSLLGVASACRDASPPPDATPSPAPAPAAAGSQAPRIGAGRLRIEGTHFLKPDGTTFEWRGITAFRLVDFVADGREDEAAAYLTWAAKEGLTIVRVLTMSGGLFDLRPEDGRRALPRMLELAAARGLRVEVVALADTLAVPVNLQEHVDEIGRIVAAHPNAVLEIANEPVHPSQSPEVHRPDVLAALAARLPREIPVSLGSIERGDGFGDGGYITWHSPRESGKGGWGHVLALAAGADILARWKKPVVSDEPIGAGPVFQPGRRDDAPARFRAAALLTRLAGLGPTFHYEAGLHALVPEGRELECFNAWNEAWTLLPADVERLGVFRAGGTPGSVVTAFDRSAILGIYERSDAATGWILVLGGEDAVVTLSDGWSVRETRRVDGGRLLNVTRSPA